MGEIKYISYTPTPEEEEKRRKRIVSTYKKKITEIIKEIREEGGVQLPLPFPSSTETDPRVLEYYDYYMKVGGSLDIADTLIYYLESLSKQITDSTSLEEIVKIQEGIDGYITLTEDLISSSEKVKEVYQINKEAIPERIRVFLQLSKQTPYPPDLAELKILQKLPPLSQIKTSKDLIQSEFTSVGDILEIGDNLEKKAIQSLQKKGKLLFGSLEGLSGGSAFFKSFSIALAKILNEQSKYYHPEEAKTDKKGGYLLSGVPTSRIKEVFGDKAKIEKNKPITINKEERDFPYILLSYEKLAKYLSKTGKITGGKDIENIRLYINGGYREFETDPKTGDRKPISSSYVPGLVSKKYPISDGKGHFVFIPFVVNEAEIVDTTRKDPEVGCLLRLSPQYSKTLRGYTALRGDTIQLIGGGGKQKDITMDIISFLCFSRNTASTLRKKKRDILSQYEKRPTYRGRPGKLEEHFKEAVQKSIEAKILLPGEDKNGKPLGYREEKNPGGEIVSVFVYNPYYQKGEEIPISPDVEEQ